jgi:hypothetical protein
MNELEKLYNALYGAGKTTKTFEEFKAQYAQDAAYRDKVYEVTYRDGLTKKDKNTFFSTYSADAAAAAPAVTPASGEVKKKAQPSTALPSANIPSALSKEPEEQDYFTGAFGDMLRGFDSVVPLGIGDFVDDIARGFAAGYSQGDVAQAADRLLLAGTKATPEQIQKFIDKQKAAQQFKPSAEMQNYQKIYEEEGKSFWGVVKGLANNPTVLPEVLASSLSAMATNTDALKAGLGAVGTGAAIGATTGATAGATAGSVVPVAGTAAGGLGGALAGATSGAISAVPYAFGLASSVVEMGSTFGELLNEELGGKDLTKENVKAILENPEKLQSIRNKAIARGAIIGTVDAFTGKLASGVGAKILTRSAGKSATGAATKAAVTGATAAGAGVEAVGGSVGEAAARGAIGQEMDVSEIALEGLAELPGGIRSTIQARLAKPVYKVNGEKVSAQEVDNLINTMTPKELASTNIEIENDYAGRNQKIQDKIVTDAIKEQVKQANPELNEPSVNAITELEKELKKLEGNTTQTGKDKAAALRAQIKGIQENQIQEEAVAETAAAVTTAEAVTPVAEKKPTRIAEIESSLAEDAKKLEEEGIGTLSPQAKNELTKELETLKAEQDAVQKQTAGQVPVQSEAGVSQEVAEGKPQAEPQVTTEEGIQKEVTPERDVFTLEDETPETVSSKTPMVEMTDEEIVEYNPIEEIADKNNEVLGKTLQSKKIAPQAEPMVTDLGDAVVFEYNNFDEGETRTRLTFNKSADGSITQKGVKIEQNVGDIRGTDLFRNYVDAKRAEAAQAQAPAQVQVAEEEVSQDVQPAPKLVRDVSVLITPATVRQATPLTKRIKTLSEKYDKLVKQFSKKKDRKTLDKIRETEVQILNDAKQEIIDAVSKVKGVSVAFGPDKRGLWDGSFEPSLNMILSITNQADTEAVSKLLFDFAEKYSQDAFILEADSNFEQDVMDGKRGMPLTEFDEFGLMHYPQIIYTFDKPITDEEVADLSVNLQNNGIDAFSINNDEIKISVIKFFPEDSQLNETEQYEERRKDFDAKTAAAAKSTDDVFRGTRKGEVDVRIKKSSYQGAKNEGTAEQTREYDRSDVLEPFKEAITKTEAKTAELAALRSEQIKLQKERKQLPKEQQDRLDELNKEVQPVVQKTFEVNKTLYEEAKAEVERIAGDAIKNLKASLSPFPIKRPERASVKTIRWYNSFTEKLGDGARVNIVVNSEADANKVFDSINKKYPVSKGDKDLRRIKETTELGYPKRLIEVRTSNGIIAEIQVITNEGYLAKDGLSGFTGDQKQKDTAKTTLNKIRERLGWAIPDGLGHYFYEIQRDVNVDDELRDEATRLSNLYYDAFTNPKSKLGEDFMDAVISFKERVDSADKTNWDKGNEGKAPAPLVEYMSQVSSKTQPEPVAEFTPMSPSDVKTEIFTKDNAIDYEEDYREDTRGREYAFISSITVEATDADGDSIGSITKLSDGEGTLSFTVEDSDGRQVGRGKEYPTLRDAKVALAEHVNKQRQKEVEREQKKAAKEKEKATAKAEKAKAREKAKQKAKQPEAEEEEFIEGVEGTFDELLELDPNDETTLQKVSGALAQALKDINKFERENLGVNIALPVMKTIIKAVKALVDAGVALQEAIKRVAKDNNVTARDIVNGINAVTQIAPIQVQYDALMAKADALIKRQKSRGIADKKIVANLDTMIRNSEVYQNATDAQRKIMEREARVKMGVGPRKAASIGRVLGVLKDITNVSRKEKLKIISRIRELSRDVAKDLSNEIRELAKEGKITTVQAANIIAKFGKVNLLNEMSVSNFVDYMAKVFGDAEYDNKIKVAKSRLAKARKNIATKIGIADGLMLPLQKLFAVDPSLIPDAYLERYLELLDMFSANEKVLTLEENNVVKSDTEAILRAIDAEQSKADELAEIFSKSDNQVFVDGELDYSASLKKMVKEEEITQEDADLMRKYKQDILPQVEPSPLTEEEINEKKKEYIKALKDMPISGFELPSSDEKKLAQRLAKLISSTPVENLMKLNLTDLKNLLKVADNINKNYLPHYAQVMVEKINAINNGKVIADAVKKAKPLVFSTLYSKFKAAIIRSQKGGIAELVRRNPLFYIDQVFGDFKTKNVFNALFEKAAEAEANFKAELKKVQNILEDAEAKVAKSFKLNPDKTLMSKFKMMTYMIQLEYESNKGSEQVNPAADYLKATIKHIDEGKSRFGERDANMLQEILDKYSTDGQIDLDKLNKSFNQAEKDAIKAIRGVNESLKDKAQYTAAIIRGDAIDPLNNYVHLNVLHDTEPLDVSAATDFLNQANNSRRPSTRAKSLIARTKGAKPLNFDVFASAQRGAKFVLLDYNLTEPIRTARRTINQATADLEAEGRLPKQQRDVKNAIEGAFEEAVSNLLTNSILQNSVADEAIDFISKQGYRAVLAGTGRFVSELTSNVAFALLADPKAFSAGTKYKDIIMSTDAPLVLENVNSKQTNRIFPSDTLAGKFVDTSILSQASGIQGRSSKNPVFNKMLQIWNRSGKKYQNVVELTADTLISTPDKLVMRPLWFGSFANEFKKITGKEVDFKKIAANDEAYMNANKDAIEQSKKAADAKSVMAGATDNAFMGILKGTVKPNQSFSTRAFNNFNNYMTRFLIFEYVTARTAIYAMVGNGTLSKKQGAAMLGAVATRMTVYTLLSQMLANGLMGIFGLGDDEEEDEKSLMQKIGQSLTSTFTSLLLGRDFGNATKAVINYGVEEVNERFLDFLREGEYDPYKDGIVYSIIPRDNRKDDDLGKLLLNMGGAFTPALNTAALIYKNRGRIVTGETEKEDEAAIEREDRTVKERIPLEVLGNLGFIPLYKDVRKVVNSSIYSSIKEAERATKAKERREADLLGGYENKTDLKRYDPELYEKNFGENSEWYKSTKEEREQKEKEAKEEQAIKDRMYNYSPKEDDGFGSAGFGQGEKKKRSKKSEGGFGSKSFGGN